MKINQLLPSTHLIEKTAAKNVKKTFLDITKELNIKPLPVEENISEALKIKSNNDFYFDSKTPTGAVELPKIDFTV